MKKVVILSIILSVTLVGMTGCRKDRSPETTWHTETVSRSDVYNKIRLNYPVVTGGPLADSVNRAVEELLCDGLFNEPRTHYASIEACLDSLLEQKNRDDITAQVPYEFQSKGSVFQYQPSGITTLELDMYQYTGGAHGLTISVLRNFDSRTGAQLSVIDIFTDTLKLHDLNTEAFRGYLVSLDIEDAEDLLFVSPDSLSLPENIGFGPDGIEMLYNQYEIAAYVFGQPRYFIPYEQVADILVIKK